MTLLRRAFNRFPHSEMRGPIMHILRGDVLVFEDRVVDYGVVRAVDIPIVRAMQRVALYFGMYTDPITIALRERIASP